MSTTPTRISLSDELRGRMKERQKFIEIVESKGFWCQDGDKYGRGWNDAIAELVATLGGKSDAEEA